MVPYIFSPSIAVFPNETGSLDATYWKVCPIKKGFTSQRDLLLPITSQNRLYADIM